MLIKTSLTHRLFWPTSPGVIFQATAQKTIRNFPELTLPLMALGFWARCEAINLQGLSDSLTQ